MKRILSLILALTMILTCAAALAETAEDQVGTYYVYNKTGLGVIAINITDNVTGNTADYTFDPSLPDGQYFLATFSIPAGEDGNHRLTFSYTVEGEEAARTFGTLSIEEATLTLLDQAGIDAMSNATPLQFGPKVQLGLYRVMNKTGAIVKTIKITDNNNAESFIETEENLAPDGETFVTYAIPDGEDGNHRLTFAYTVEGEEEARSFGTLSIEQATLTLLDQAGIDAMSNATPLQFGPLTFGQ